MGYGPMAHRVYEVVTRPGTGLIAIVIALASGLKNLLDSRKTKAEITEIKAHVDALVAQRENLLSDSRLKRRQAEELEYQLRSLHEHRAEIEKALDVIRERSTSLYNEVVRIYEPFLAGSPKLTKTKLKEKLREVQRFARQQTHRPQIEEAWNYLRQLSENRAEIKEGTPLDLVVETARSFLDAVSADRCYLTQISEAADSGFLKPEFLHFIRRRIEALELSFKDLIACIGICRA